jgi:predicted acyltransferase
MGRIRERGGHAAAYRRIARRVLIMFVLGVIYSGGFAQGLENVRIMGVLQRLGICYGVTALLFCHLDTKKLVAVFICLLLAYWAWLTFVPVPGLGRTSFAMGETWPNYLDQHFLPLRKFNGDWDPEGLLSTIPAVGSCLLGLFAGQFLKSTAVPGDKKGLYLIGAGIALLVAGYLWGLQFPVIKKIWTSSYVLVAGGYSCILLGMFYQVIDVWKVRKWSIPFRWIGSNAIVIYMSANLVGFTKIAERLVGGPIHDALGAAGDMAVTTVALAMILFLAKYLYDQRIFIRI